MGKRGPKPKGTVKIEWSANFAYAIGLIVSDGSLSKNGRHIIFTSKDIQQINNFRKCLQIDVKLGKSYSDASGRRQYYNRLQFGDVLFYHFLVSIGLTSNKSKTIGEVKIPEKYFFDFLRGSFDGDGTFYSYWDKRWKSSFMFYLEFISASRDHINWLRKEIENRLGILGHVTNDGKGSTSQLKYAKKDAIKIINKMYYGKKVMNLSRKRLKINKALAIEKKQQKTYEK